MESSSLFWDGAQVASSTLYIFMPVVYTPSQHMLQN